MPLATIVNLEATDTSIIDQFTGKGVHGFWFRHWSQVDSQIAAQLHVENLENPFTLSPLMNLPAPHHGITTFPAGTQSWFRVTILSDELKELFTRCWMPSLPEGEELFIPAVYEEDKDKISGVRWKVKGFATQEMRTESLVNETSYTDLARGKLMNSNPPHQWKIEFLTPTTFHSKTTQLPFPLPNSLVNSWLRRWQAFSPLALPSEELLEWVRNNLAVSSYRLRTHRVNEGDRYRIGCVGTLTLRAYQMPPYLRACVDLLAEYAQFCGSGNHTAQGLGQTRLVWRG
jgi:CRISPR-associated endoribonuclease Cas6